MMFVSRSSAEDRSARVKRSTDRERSATDRGAVEPVAALVALVAVGAALGLYTVALDDAAPDRDRDLASTTADRIEREASVGGVVSPGRVANVEAGSLPPAIVELETRRETWRLRFGAIDPSDVPGDDPFASAVDVAERSVTVRVAPGEHARGTLRVVVHA